MSFAPDLSEEIARARSDLRMGVPLVLHHDGREMLVQAAETLTAERFDAARAMSGETHLAITARRAETLKARVYADDVARIILPAFAGYGWVQAVADPSSDLNTPMKGPLHSAREGSATNARMAIYLTKTARLLPAALMTELADGAAFARTHNLTRLNSADLAEAAGNAADYKGIIRARLPMEVSETGALHVFRPDDGGEEHYAVIVGKPDLAQPVLTRLHSACFTGDVMGSLKCDCGPQLRAALAHMGDEGAGILLYLNQEGRGIGLANKMRAYFLQDQGFDTVEANHRLGFEDDERDFRIGAAILQQLGVQNIRLLTNNPAKLAMMQRNSISVTERVALKVGETRFNRAYLDTKARKSGHML